MNNNFITNEKDLLLKISSIEGWLKNNEAITLYFLASKALLNTKSDEVLIEIGSFKGKSTVAIAQACKDQKKGLLVAIDQHAEEYYYNSVFQTGGTYLDLKKNLLDNHLEKYVKVVKLRSIEAYKKFRKLKSKFLFIDADHSMEAVRKDYEMWSNTLQNNGYLLLHDALDLEGPRMLVHFLLKDNKYSFLGYVGNLASFQKKTKLSIRDVVKKVYVRLVLFLFFFKVYRPYSS